METPLISKRQFNRIRKYLPVRKNVRSLDDRMVISAIILVIKYGLAWRHIPEFYGKWTSNVGKDRVTGIMRGLVIPDYDLLSSLPKGALDKLDVALPAIALLRMRG